MKVNLYAPYRQDPLLAIRLLADEEEEREQAVQRFIPVKQYLRVPAWLRIAVICVVVFLLSWLFLAVWPANADSLTDNQIAQQLKQGSPISLRQNVADFWADNLLAAQDPTVCSYCASEPRSLQLSVNAVLKAIGLEQTLAGLTWCNLTNCVIANAQSTIAIDTNASGGLTPRVLYFGEVAVSTPEPGVTAFLMCGLLLLLALGKPRRRNREYLSAHPYRKSA